ncbi:MAG: cupin domain-containing protein [Propionibacteriales bacterium]|nr:cupin domain-containing protein [Propionibacteriales bacterium]
MARVGTATTVTHYEIQKWRRAKVIEEWRKYRTTIVRADDVEMEESPNRRMPRGVYMGADGDHLTKVLDATRHGVPPCTVSTVHRHSWDAIMFVMSGVRWREIDGQRVSWKRWDTLHLPSWAWHRHGNDSDRGAQFVTWSVEPMYEAFGVAVVEEDGDAAYEDLPAPPGRGQPRRRHRCLFQTVAATDEPGARGVRPQAHHTLGRGRSQGDEAGSAQHLPRRPVDRSSHSGFERGHARARTGPAAVAAPARRGMAGRGQRPRAQRHRRQVLRVERRRPGCRGPLSLAPALQRRQEQDRAADPRAQLRCVVRHDAGPPRPARSLGRTTSAGRARPVERRVARPPSAPARG